MKKTSMQITNIKSKKLSKNSSVIKKGTLKLRIRKEKNMTMMIDISTMNKKRATYFNKFQKYILKKRIVYVFLL